MSTVLHVKIDEDLKKEAQAIAKRLGLPLSTVISHGLQNFVSTRSLTFTEEPKLKSEVAKELRKLQATNKDLSPEFTSAKEASKWLQS